MSDLKNLNVENSLADLEDCLMSLPGKGEKITAEMKAKIEKAKKSLQHLRNAISGDSGAAAAVDPCARRPAVSAQG
jgi:hypothetical protein